jgi:tetratricopeptide (TPR) repeat protein
MAKTWQQSEISYLNRYAATKTLAELARRFEADEARVLAKLAELGLRTKDGKPAAAAAADPVFEVYEEALGHLYKGRWEKAAKLFDRVAGESDQPELAARARQLLAAARRRAAEAEGTDGPPDDPFLAAVYQRNRGDYAAALKICRAGGRQHKDERFAYLEAALLTLEGREQEAAEALARAVELNPKNRVHAFHDPDFATLRAKQEHAALFGLG